MPDQVNKASSRSLTIGSILLVLSLAMNGLLAYEYVRLQETQKQGQKSRNVIGFTKLLVDKVLGASGEISVDSRIELENAVRGLNNPEIVDQWKKFTESKTEADMQIEVTRLLRVLMKEASL